MKNIIVPDVPSDVQVAVYSSAGMLPSSLRRAAIELFSSDQRQKHSSVGSEWSRNM